MKERQETIEEVAQGLGWIQPKHYHTWVSDKYGNISDHPVMLAAFAKAAMADRGWRVCTGINPRVTRMMRCVQCGEPPEYQHTQEYPYDPTDPLSVATAELQAIAEALGMEGEG